MTINTLFMFLALAIGAGTSQSVEPTIEVGDPIGKGKFENNCYINGVWYNPCPSDPSFDPDHGLQILLQD